MARVGVQGVVGLLHHQGASALIPGRMHNGPDENEAAEKLPKSRRA